jgi:hypothetical protein
MDRNPWLPFGFGRRRAAGGVPNANQPISVYYRCVLHLFNIAGMYMSGKHAARLPLDRSAGSPDRRWRFS